MGFDIDRLPRQDGRTVVITGANTGLGFHNARDLAALGARVVLACRSEARATDAIGRIASEVPGADLEYLALDLSSLASVRAAADAFRERHDRLDVLVNNAAIMWAPHRLTADGFESQMAVNYWGHFLLTMLLIDLLPDVPESRVVVLSSIAHAGSDRRIRFDDPHWTRGYKRHKAYAQTKLACLMFALELDRRLRAAGRRAISAGAHPGISPTELGRAVGPWLMTTMKYTVGPFMSHRPSVASRSTLVAAVGPGVQGGDYYGPQGRKERKGDPGRAVIRAWASDPDTARRLWELSVELTGADLPF